MADDTGDRNARKVSDIPETSPQAKHTPPPPPLETRSASDRSEATSPAKRRLLSRLGAGGGVLGVSALVPATWVKPVINAVMLPAHAAHSPGHPASPDDMEEPEPEPEPTAEELAAIAARSPATIRVTGAVNSNLLRAYVEWTPPTNAANLFGYFISWRNVTETEFRPSSLSFQLRAPNIQYGFTPSLPTNDPVTRSDSWVVQVAALYPDSNFGQADEDLDKYVTTTTVTTDQLLTTIQVATRTSGITRFNDVGPYTGLVGQLDDLLQ